MSTRKQLRAQIAAMTQTLHQRQIQEKTHEHSLERVQVNYSFLILVAVLVPAFWLGWKASKEKWTTKFATYLAELVTLALSTYFRKQLVNYLKH